MKKVILLHALAMSKRIFYIFLIQCLSMSLLFANNGNAQIKKIDEVQINLNLANLSIVQAFSTIESESGFNFVYTNKELKNIPVVSIQSNKSVYDVLVELSVQTGLQFKQVNNNIHVRKGNSSNLEKPVSIQEKVQETVSGVILDDTNSPLPGVSVIEKGTSNGVVTDLDGKFTLTVNSEESVLIFSFIGMQTIELPVGDRRTFNLTMTPDETSLDEVIVVGYGTVKKSDLTGSVGVVGSEELLKAPINNALQGLKGKVAGVNVFLNSGSPSSSPRVLIRGLGTINSSSQPLYVVDGVVMENIEFLNPNDIESMEVLKDASSTAIYGARGANGVIMVSTKRGAKTLGTSVGYDGFFSIGVLPKKLDVLNAEEFMEVLERGFANHSKYRPNSPIPAFTKNDPNLFDANGNPLYDTDWQEEATRTAISHNHQLSFQSKAEKSSFGAFLNYADMEGIMLNNYLKRINGKFAFDAQPKEWLSIGINLLANTTNENVFEESGGHQMPRRSMIEMPAIFPVQFPDGTYSNSSMVSDPYGLEAIPNPVHVLKTQDRLRKRTKLFGNFYTTFHILPGLDLRSQIGFDKNDYNEQIYSPTDLINISSPNGYAYLANNRSLYWQQENYLTYTKEFGDHSINAMAGLSWQKRTSEFFNVSARGFSDDTFTFNRIQAASQPGTPNSGYDEWSMNSYFLRGNYNFKDKYLVTFTGRVDGSSRFGDNNKYGVFPSVGVGYVLSNEPFMQGLANSIDELKIRSSFGVTGNTEIPTYQSLGTISAGTTLLNGTRAPISYVNRLPNPDLEWEKTNQFDVGFDLAVLNRALVFSFDYYYKITNDLLLDRPVPSSSGFAAVRDNIGSVSNRGVEVLVKAFPITTNDFSWESNLNFSYNKNRIEKLGENDEDIFPGPYWVSGSQTILRVGEPLSSFWGFERLGTWGTDEAAEAAEVGAIPGEAKRSAERKIIGNGLPKWTGSFINNFYYKNFDLTLDVQFVAGVDILQQFFHSTQDRTGFASGLSDVLYDAWTEDNQNTMVQQIRNGPYSGQNSEVDSQWVTDGSYIRGNLISLGYTFNDLIAKNKGFNKLRVYANVQNAFLIHSKDFKGYDPESSSWEGNQWGQNIFFFQYPRPRTFTVGLSLQF
ncbi:SusC/RagA family TonB-linked outer membrane protein [Algoriphagus halophilus]|uniref:TonB-linked outer membrane protein, SusC/RagA family n=1 Tax=Algoriphagus halophilus TaxID=226505 RepID=A0A1N6EKI2_9BACT|nr:TonB-dependent receptor [Algoriphagus halophilus]SIN83589.1 TonB-linked outer membrane protein, SusC/RagA family [Algoriphagus halophilus]